MPPSSLLRFVVLGGRVPVFGWATDEDGTFVIAMWHGERPATLALSQVVGIWGGEET